MICACGHPVHAHVHSRGICMRSDCKCDEFKAQAPTEGKNIWWWLSLDSPPLDRAARVGGGVA